MAVIGSSIIGLAFLFPQEVRPISRRTWVHFILFGISTVLVIWALLVLYDRSNPWAYVRAWQACYIYATCSILLFLAAQAYHLIFNPPGLARQQARIILWGGVMAFTPLIVWFAVPQLIGVDIPWNPAIFLPLLLIFPIAIGLAILRYRLWDIDLIIRRTLVYTILTFILATLYWFSLTAFGMMLRDFTANNQLILVFSTLGVVALATPLRRRVQEVIDRRFYRQRYDAEKTLMSFSTSLRDEVDLDTLSDRLLAVIETTMYPEHVLLWLKPAEQITFKDEG